MTTIDLKYKVSVIVPTRNSAKTLPKCLQSIKNQSFKLTEILVIDSHSKDNTIDIAKKSNAKIFQTTGYQSEARNIGLLHSSGDFILFLDSDQTLTNQVIEECINLCLNKKKCMIRIPEVFIGDEYWSKCSALWRNNYDKVESIYRHRLDLIHGKPRFFSREILLEVDSFDKSLLWGEDYDLSQRLKNLNVKETSCKATVYHNETLSLKQFLLKNIRYANSITIFKQKVKGQNFSTMIVHSLLTFFNILKKPPRFSIMLGCGILFFIKTAATIIGLLTNQKINLKKS